MKKYMLIISALLAVSFLIDPFMGFIHQIKFQELPEDFEETTILNPPLEEGEIVESEDKKNEKEEISEIISDKINYVRVLTDGESIQMNVSEYLSGVISGEMPALYPEEALKAQAVAARTYMMYQIQRNKHDNADLCDDPGCCMAYKPLEIAAASWTDSSFSEKIKNSVEATDGQILIYEGETVLAAFHATSGGYTEKSENVWGEALPYLSGVESFGDLNANTFLSTVTLTRDECEKKLLYIAPKANFKKHGLFTNIEKTEAGYVKSLNAGGIKLSGGQIRRLFGLRSTNFTINVSSKEIIFEVKGYGHGVGMSQTGARAMALEGKSYEEILLHYYPGCEIEKTKITP